MDEIVLPITCYQCGAPLPIEQGRQFVTCEFCGAENFVDKRTAVLHYVVRDTIGIEEAQSALRRWMGGNSTVKDLDKKANITETVFELFPMWLVRAKKNDQEKVFLEPAAALTVTELKELTIPASDLESYDHTLDGKAIPPTVPAETMKKWLSENKRITPQQITEVSLVHVPLFRCKYQFDGRSYTAVVDASSSRIFANVFPSKWEAPYLAVGLIAFVTYFCAALIPYGMYAADESIGLGIVIYAVVAIFLALPIFAVAAYVSAKV